LRWRRFFIGVVALVAMLLVILLLLLPRMLEQLLPDLLAERVDQPVVIEDVSLSLLPLGAEVSRLLVGAAEAPGLLVEKAAVQLDAAELLHGRVRILSTGAESIRVDLNAWQDDGSAEPLDLELVESWLPDQMFLNALEVYSGKRLIAKTANNSFLRSTETLHQLSWTQAGLSSPLEIRVGLSSLTDFSRDKQGRLRIEIAQESTPEQQTLIVEASMVATGTTGVETRVQLNGQAISGSWLLESGDIASWPEQSTLQLQMLDVPRLQDLIADLMASVSANDMAKNVETPAAPSPDWLQTLLPQVALPSHEIELQIDQLLFGTESIRSIKARIDARAGDVDVPAEVQLRDLTARLAGANLQGDVALALAAKWELSADLRASSDGKSDPLFENALLFWQGGLVDLTTSGTKPVELLENARGSFAANGLYLAAEALPMNVRADFNGARGLLGSDALEIQVGESIVKGALWTDEARQALSARLSSPLVNLDSLSAPNVASDDAALLFKLPDSQWLPVNLPIDIEFVGDRILVAGVAFTDVELRFKNEIDKATVEVSLHTPERGHIALTIAGQHLEGAAAVNLDLNVSSVDLKQLGLDVPLGVSSARLNLTGRGVGLPAVVSNLAGEASFELTTELLSEAVRLTAKPSIGVEADQIVSVSLSDLDLRLGETTRTQGELLVALPGFAVTGELNTSVLDLDALLVSADDARAATDPTPLLPLLQDLPAVDLQIGLGELTFGEQTLSDTSLRLQSQAGGVDIVDASFNSPYGAALWQASLVARNGAADVKVDGSIRNLNVASFNQSQIKDLLDKPLGGTVSLQGRGENWAELYLGSRLHLKLDAARPGPNQRPAFDIDVELRALGENQWQADIADLYWRNSDVQGRVVFRNTQPPELRADLTAGFLDLTQFEQSRAEAGSKVSNTGLIRSVSNTTARALGFLANSVRSTVGVKARPADSASKRFFSAQPWSLAVMDVVDAEIKIAAARVKSRRGEARDVTFRGDLGGGQLDVQMQSPQANGGPIDFVLAYDASQQPALAKLSLSLENVRLNPLPGVVPMSAFVDLSARGNSERSLASSLTGHVFIQAGAGSARFADFGGGLLTGDLVQGVFGKLLPAADRPPDLNCAVGYGELVDGSFAVPATIVMQTPVANVLIQAQADFKQETISAQLDSRSLKGTGISLGNVFSNTVQLEGSLSTPEIVSNTKGLLWRYGAALATGGISLIGESVYKRLMVDRNACATMKTTLQEKVCVPGSKLVNSALVCG
jgi:hypothetical protein